MSSSLHRRLLAMVPDHPLTVETRAVLLSPECELFGEAERPGEAVVREKRARLVAAIGHPGRDFLLAATQDLEGPQDLVAPLEELEYLAAALPGWRAEPADILALPEAWQRPAATAAEVRLLAGDEPVLRSLPARLRREAADARGPLAAAFSANRPVSLCIAFRETESLWDVSIETIEGYRRRGLASAVFLCLERHQARRGRRPVWGALESNRASLALARRLGFEPVGRLAVLGRNQ